MGRIVVADIGIEAESRLSEIGKPKLRAPGPEDHKYSRGYVAVIAGEMPGAAALTATAAARAGAGYVRLAARELIAGLPQAVVQGAAGDVLEDERVDVLVAGPGFGRGAEGEALFKRIKTSPAAKLFDADALWRLGAEPTGLDGALLTPHAGEFRRLFPNVQGSKVEQARAAAALSGAVIVYKGADTVVAAPDGRAAIARPAPNWLASAGTGDVLAGIVAAQRAAGMEPFEAACAGVWLHARAAELAGPALIADDLIAQLPRAVAECL
jgi:hydroxyethylthiazole kinase-like uncharacterized protein yjeF